jgi:hypothetical protein
MTTSLREVRWPEVVASAVVLVGLVVVGLYFHSYEPKGFSDAEVEAAQRKALVNCGYSMFDVEPKSMRCPAFDAISVEVEPGGGTGLPGYAMTLHADGGAQLDVRAPEADRGAYEGSVDAADFRRLSNLLATLALDRRGGIEPQAQDGGRVLVRAGCRGEWAFTASHGGEAGEVPGYARCLDELKASISWDRK